MMKKIMLAALACVMLASCGKGSDAPAVTVSVETSAPVETTALPETTLPETTEITTVVEISPEVMASKRAELEALAAEVPDLYGWISVDGTDIDYVMVQSADNDYYLDHSPYKQWQEIGSIFVDFRNRKNVEDPYNQNIVVYGHNLTWGGMFHSVETMFWEEELFRSSYIYIYTLDGIYVYKPFAVYEANAYYQYFRTQFDAPEEFIDFAYEMKDNSKYPVEVEFDGDDAMLTLSTCTNTYVDGRYSLQSKLVQVTRWE